ncbi:hypothetical protein OAE21_02960 [Rubripirellula sp.]|nr:hypothetical protein [Rubripirellula sp.]MDB4625012.1 hypothetical protein [Rubripirellula sp.]
MSDQKGCRSRKQIFFAPFPSPPHPYVPYSKLDLGGRGGVADRITSLIASPRGKEAVARVATNRSSGPLRRLEDRLAGNRR